MYISSCVTPTDQEIFRKTRQLFLNFGGHDIHFLRFTCGVTPLPVYLARIAGSGFPHIHVSAEVGS